MNSYNRVHYLFSSTTQRINIQACQISQPTFEAIIELAWQIILYKALPTVLVRTVPALREVRLTET